jgi:hypothetical protein
LDFDFGVVLFCQGVMMTVVYMNTHDVYQMFLRFNVPGVRKDAGRLWKGVNSGDAGVMNELLQAACDPSAGQQALQAGEASAVGVAAIEDARPTGQCMELEAEERRFELKRKADFYEIELVDLQLEQKRKAWLHALEVEEQRLKLPLAIKKLQLEHVDHFFESLSRLNPAWRADPRLSVQAQDLLCNVFDIGPRLAATQGAAAGGGAAPGATVGPKERDADKVWRGKHCMHGKRAYRCNVCHAC